MKKLFILLSVICLVFSSCSVYEDIHFLENGNMKYSMTIDAGEMVAALGSSSLKTGKNDIPSDSIIYFSRIIKDSLNNIPADIAQDLKNIEPLYMHIKTDESNNEYKISICGDFDNVQAFSDAFASMGKLEEYIKKSNDKAKKFSFESLYNNSQLTWDGTTLKRIFTKTSDNPETGDNSEDSKKIDESITRLFSQGKMIVRYHFPKKIKDVSNKNATFSLDAKTAVVEYSAMQFVEPTEALSITIVTE